jgi:hypothetical protein
VLEFVRNFSRLVVGSVGMFVLAGCSADDVLGLRTTSPDSVAALEADEAGPDGKIEIVPLVTSDGFNQTAHPDYAFMPAWSPRRYLVATPYAFSDTRLENPSLFAQFRGYEWRPHAVENPIVRGRKGYLSDPDMVAVEDRNELWIYYREVTSRNTIWLIKSGDGLSWTKPKRVVSAPRQMLVSPAVVRRDTHEWLMWSVNAGSVGCTGNSTSVELRRSADGAHWTLPTRVALSQPPFSVWHIDVQWIPSREEYWAVYNAKRPGNCNTDVLFLATSKDGIEWQTYPSPLLRAGAIPEFNEVVYRSTFAYNPRTDNIRFWYSGAHWESSGYVWHTAYQRRKRADVFAAISAQPLTPLSAKRRSDVPMLVNPP